MTCCSLCVVFSCVCVAFTFVSGSTSELRVRLVPLKSYSAYYFTDRSKKMHLLCIFLLLIKCFMFVLIILSCLLLAAL